MGRTQRVSVNGSVSFSKQVLNGIPQGSVIDPLLFVMYFNSNTPTFLVGSHFFIHSGFLIFILEYLSICDLFFVSVKHFTIGHHPVRTFL